MKTLQQIDAEIAQCEQQLEVLHEQRREWVNHLGLNKRVIRDEDFAYRCVDTLSTIQCTHIPTGFSSSRAFGGSGTAFHAQCYAHSSVCDKLLAEGWVHAS